MDKDTAIFELKAVKTRLKSEVVNAYKQRGSSFGDQRFAAWRKKFTAFLLKNLPSQVAILNEKLTHYAFSVDLHESDFDVFWRQDGEPMEAFIDSLILDIQNDEFDFSMIHIKSPMTESNSEIYKSKIFIVHGHDGEAKQKTARFIEKLGLKAIILHEQASRGKTIIEKIEEYSDVGFAIVLYTPDDLGNVKEEAANGKLRYRARQNVVFEHGLLIGKIGREKVIPLVSGEVELPNDISGVIYIGNEQWQVDVAKEMKAAGYSIDLNTIL